MTDNLSAMVQNLPEETTTKTELPTPAEVQDTTPSIPVTMLSSWIHDNAAKLPNIKNHALTVKGVDPSKTLVLSDVHPKGGSWDGNSRRKIYIVEDADKIRVLNKEANQMRIYKHSVFSINYEISPNCTVKCFGAKNGMTLIFSVLSNDMLIPYAKMSTDAKKEKVPILPVPIQNVIDNMLAAKADTEGISLMYKQIASEKNINTNQNAIQWFLDRQKSAYDAAHILLIDDIIISMFKTV